MSDTTDDCEMYSDFFPLEWCDKCGHPIREEDDHCPRCHGMHITATRAQCKAAARKLMKRKGWIK